jgi:hypothetical protein
MRTIPLNLEEHSASALYILLDTALSSLTKEQAAVEALKQLPQDKRNITDAELLEMENSLASVLDTGKIIISDVAAIIDELDKEPEFKPFIKSSL